MSPDDGSYASLFTSASHDLKREQSREYFEWLQKGGWKLGTESRLAKDMSLAEKLETWTNILLLHTTTYIYLQRLSL